MKAIATRIAAILVATVVSIASLFATNVAAQEAAKPVIEGTVIPAAEVMKMIKAKGIQFLRDDGTLFKAEYAAFDGDITVGPVKGKLGTAKITSSTEVGSEKICWETYGKGKNGCLTLFKTKNGTQVVMDLIEKIGLKEKETVVYKLTFPEL